MTAARYAVEHWHYSRQFPGFKCVTLGVWEGGEFIGAVVFGYSATPNVARSFRLPQQQIAELTRVALRKHVNPVSRILRICITLLKKQSPGLKLLISFADADQDHIGSIYQAGNWVYTGKSMEGERNGYVVGGKFLHCRSAGMKGRNTLGWVRANLDRNAQEHRTRGKHRYLMPLDDEMRARIAPLARPYPKRERKADSGRPPQEAEAVQVRPARSIESP